MKKDLLEKELQKEIRKFKWKRRFLRFNIWINRQKLKIFSFWDEKSLTLKDNIDNLIYDIQKIEKKETEEIFYRLYLRED